MFCPVCGQQQVSEETRFCSRCGFLLTGVANVITNGGALPHVVLPHNSNLPTPRRKGLKQGGAMFLFGIFIVPLLGVLSSILWFPRQIVGLAAIVFFLGGILRMVYAAIFESGNPADKTLEENVVATANQLFGKNQVANALPPPQSIPVESYMPPQQGSWRDTNDLTAPTSVTEQTTKFLDRK